MRKLFIAVFLALVMMAFSLSLVLAQGGQAEINEIFSQTEDIRELEASPNVAVSYLSQPELRDKMLQEFEQENPEEELRDAQDIMVMLGFIEPDLDLRQLLIDLYTEQIAGFYDPEDNSLYLVSEEQKEMSISDRYTLSHELTHYLQDQNFDLMRPPFYDEEDTALKTDDDASFAASCLVEGDAMITSGIWETENLTSSERMEMQMEGMEYSFDVFYSAPEYIQDSLLFPYSEGQMFTEYIYKRGGFDAVDKAYSDPPASTEQIYHPEKYTSNEAVVEVELPDISADLGEGWELAYDNVLGEFDVYELFKPYFSDRYSRKAAEGWGGNNYHYYRNQAGDKLLVQEYAWDSEQDAQEFSSAYIEYIDSRFKGDVEDEASSDAWRIWSTDDYQLGLKKDGLDTYLVQSTSGEPFDAVMAELGGTGDQIEEGAIGEGAAGTSGEEKDYRWLIIGVVIGLLAVGLILVVVMLILYRRPPTPPYQPPGGPYTYPGGGTGPYYGVPPGGYGGAGPGGVPGSWGQAPPPPPQPPPTPPQVPPPPGQGE